MYMLALTMAQALIALHGQTAAAFCWLASVITFVVVTAFGNDLFMRVELGLVAGSLVAAASMGYLVLRRSARRRRCRPCGISSKLSTRSPWNPRQSHCE